MIQPGRETNLPTSSGAASGQGGMYGYKLAAFDGFTVTMGMVLLLIVGFLMYQTFFTRKRR